MSVLFVLSLATLASTFEVKPVIDVAVKQYVLLMQQQLQLGHQYPTHGVLTDTHWAINSNPTRNSVDWVDGFFPGVLWQLYNHTKDMAWKDRAHLATEGLNDQQYNDQTHDVGFLVLCSFGEAYALTQEKTYPDVIVNAAQHLASRFNSHVGALRSWGSRTETKDFLVIVDNMMNLELLFKAHEFTKNETFFDIAVSHANLTAREHLRGDYSSFHVVNFNQTDGSVIQKYTAQGYSDSSCWSRGQAWLVTGFTKVFIYTKMHHFLDTAEHVAKYFISHLPEDGIPPWDFQAPHNATHPYVPRDVSAGAIASVGLFELYGITNNTLYLDTAHKIVQSLGSSKYLATGNSAYHLPALLANSTMSKAATHPEQADLALIYADYYYLKALNYLQQYPIKA